MFHLFAVIVLAVLAMPRLALAEERFPPPDFRNGYQLPQTQFALPRAPVWSYIDLAALAAALSLAAYLVLKRRSRRGVFLLTICAVAYFGFYRKGCICAVGSVQNVALSLFNSDYALPWTAAGFFLLPLLFTLLFGRVFCSSVCPLGAIQDLVLWRPVQVPAWLEAALGLFAYFYLGISVLLAAVGSEFLICRYDPFVGFFRLSAPAHMLLIGAVLLVLSMFVGRTYCRFICPYGVLLRLLSPFSKWRVSITPQACVNCRLCEASCPYGAIRHPTPQNSSLPRHSGKTQLALLLMAFPVLLGALTWLGYRTSGTLSRLDADVQLAQRIWQEDHAQVKGTTDASSAFRNSGQDVEQLYQRARAIEHRFIVGGMALGAWMGCVIGVKLIALSVRRRRGDYDADPGRCLACARCYQACPVEVARHGPVPASAVFSPSASSTGFQPVLSAPGEKRSTSLHEPPARAGSPCYGASPRNSEHGPDSRRRPDGLPEATA